MSRAGDATARPVREVLLASLFYLALTVLMTWPQAPRLSDGITDLWDAKLNAWILQWDVYQGLRHPLDLFQAPIFHPAKYALAFSENLVGAAVFGAPLLLAGVPPLVSYNAILLLGMFLSAIAAWALAREVTGDAAASLLAGVVFAFVPWRLSQLPHVQFQWGAFLCLALLFLIRYLRAGARRDLVLYAVSFAWNALTNVHYAIFSGFAVAAALVVHAGASHGPERARRLRGALLATLIGALPFVPFAIAYARASALYGMVRRLGEMMVFSGRWTDFLSAGVRNRTWGPATARWTRAEADFFPGICALALAGVALVVVRREAPSVAPASARTSSRRLRQVLDAAWGMACVLWLASLGLPGLRLGPVRLGDPGRVLVVWTALAAMRLWVALPGGGRFASVPDWMRRSRLEPGIALFALLGAVGIVVALGANTPYYRFLFVSASRVFGAIRAPSRGIVLFHIALAMLAAWGLAAWTRGRPASVRAAAIAGAVLVTVFEYRAFPLTLYPYDPQPAAIYRWARGLELDGAIVEWPIGPIDAEYVVRQADHRQALVNGYSGFFPPEYLRLRDLASRPWIPEELWPAMRAAGARVLIYHSGDAEPPRRAAFRRSIRGALERGDVALLHASPGVSGTDLAFRLPDGPRAQPDAGSRPLLDEFLAVSDALLYLPHIGVDFAGPVAAGEWHGGWVVDDSGIAEVRIDSERGPAGLGLLRMRFPGIARAFPDIEEAADDRAGFGFRVPDLPPGPHTLTFTVTAKDGGVTVVTRPIVVKASTLPATSHTATH